jgi:hypothetical protein
VKQLELNQVQKPVKPGLPAWLERLIDQLSEQFEPFSGMARVGYECQQTEDAWEVALFLGENEIVGGAEDGWLRPVNFRYNLLDLFNLFDVIDALHWNAFPSSYACLDEVADLSVVAAEGRVQGHLVRVQVHAGPPECVGPGMREHGDGRVELT